MVFGAGVRHHVASEADALGVAHAVVVSSAAQRREGERIADALGKRCAGLFADAAMHTPVDVTEQALRYLARVHGDATVAIGGGSAIGLSKAMALRTDMPQIVLPTSYAGSEMTAILGQTDAGRKTTQRSERVRAEVVLYDVELTLTLPAAFSATSGLNALAHLAEALYARDAEPVTSLMAEAGVRALAQALPAITLEPADIEARNDAFYGAYLGGCCLGSVGMSLHHKLCHVLGGSFGLPHAETHAVVLPHALAYNEPAAPRAFVALGRALGSDEVPAAMWRLARSIGAPASLAVLGMARDDLSRAVDLTMAEPYWSPRALDRDGISRLIQRAWAGEPPLPD